MYKKPYTTIWLKRKIHKIAYTEPLKNFQKDYVGTAQNKLSRVTFCRTTSCVVITKQINILITHGHGHDCYLQPCSWQLMVSWFAFRLSFYLFDLDLGLIIGRRVLAGFVFKFCRKLKLKTVAAARAIAENCLDLRTKWCLWKVISR